MDEALAVVAGGGDTDAARRLVREGLAQSDAGQMVARMGLHTPLLLGEAPAARAAERGLTVASFGHDTTTFLLLAAARARYRGDAASARAHAAAARRRA